MKMKFLSTIIAAIVTSSASATHHSADIYYHEKKALGPSMWHFSADGLTIYSVDGSKVLRAHRKESVCKPYVSWRGGVSTDCYYFTQASDGHKFVWAGSLAGTNKVEAFDIDSGDYAGYIPTCSTPLDLEYHPHREEMWLRCAANGVNSGEIDVFSSNSLSADFEHIHLNDTSRPYGRIAIHSDMGPYGYVSAYDQAYLSELDLSTKEVVERHELPKSKGSYDMTYSPVNSHIFTRGRVTCSCGFDGADLKECGSRAGKVDVLTGPTAGMMNVNGTSGAGCEGSTADTLGVFEFDTIGKKIVANHNIKEGTGFGADPVSSPDGKHILLLGNDGGKFVRLLSPGENGAASTVAKDIPVDFEGGLPTKTVVSDFAFVTDETRNILILGASTDNDLVLVDLNDDYKTTKITLSEASETTGGSRRNIEWAVGSNFVWVDGGGTQEQYIIELPDDNINNAKLVRSLTNITAGNMIYVENYERTRVAQEAEQLIMSMTSKSEIRSSSSGSVDDSESPVAVAALVLGILSLLLGVALVILVARGPAPSGNTDGRTLGSKNVA